jgi:hypothetical protein
MEATVQTRHRIVFFPVDCLLLFILPITSFNPSLLITSFNPSYQSPPSTHLTNHLLQHILPITSFNKSYQSLPSIHLINHLLQPIVTIHLLQPIVTNHLLQPTYLSSLAESGEASLDGGAGPHRPVPLLHRHWLRQVVTLYYFCTNLVSHVMLLSYARL